MTSAPTAVVRGPNFLRLPLSLQTIQLGVGGAEVATVYFDGAFSVGPFGFWKQSSNDRQQQDSNSRGDWGGWFVCQVGENSGFCFAISDPAVKRFYRPMRAVVIFLAKLREFRDEPRSSVRFAEVEGER